VNHAPVGVKTVEVAHLVQYEMCAPKVRAERSEGEKHRSFWMLTRIYSTYDPWGTQVTLQRALLRPLDRATCLEAPAHAWRESCRRHQQLPHPHDGASQLMEPSAMQRFQLLAHSNAEPPMHQS